MKLKSESQQLVREEIENAQVPTVEQPILFSLNAARENNNAARLPPLRSSLYDLLTQPPFAGSQLNLERVKDDPRSVDL